MQSQEESEFQEAELRKNIRKNLSRLKQLLADSSLEWQSEDLIYRFYHQSFKVYRLQSMTEEMVRVLKELLPRKELNSWFLQIVKEGTGKEFTWKANGKWLETTRPILEAFFHARYFLEMAVRYGKSSESFRPLPSGWAALLYLYNLR